MSDAGMPPCDGKREAPGGIALPQSRDGIARLVPHQGRMCLWQRVVAWDERRIVLQAFDHADADHPLRHRGRLHAVHLCEYGAQAMAVHGGLRGAAAGTSPRPGLLVALRGVELHRDRFDDVDGPIEGQAEVLMESVTGWQYAFTLRAGVDLLAEGRAAVIHPPG